MVRIITNTGCVDVTDDHSLLNLNKQEISSNDCDIGTEVLHYKINFDEFNDERTSSLDNTYINQSILYYKTYGTIPEFILNANKEIKQSFIKRIYGNRTEISENSQIASSQIFYIIQSIGYNAYINTINDKYVIRFSSVEDNVNNNKIIKMHTIENYNNYVYDLTTENHHFAAGIGNMIVHNTDSVFFTFNLKDENGVAIKDQKALEITIEMAKEAGHLATKFLKGPHDLEYEKTFLPFALLSKKRYVGMLYEDDPNKCYRKSMGIVLKRRDNAPIVKDVYGGIIDILMNEKDVTLARKFLENMLDKIVNKDIIKEKLIISKSLRAFYKAPNSIAHKVLANRIAERDPGNKPSPGDRIPYIYIVNNNKKALQGEKIETPQYIKDNNVKIDYGFYISNQIMKPVTQLFSLVLYNMVEFKKKKNNFIQQLKTLESNLEFDKYQKKEQDLKNKEIENILFKKYLIIGKQQKLGNKDITSFFNN